MGEEHTLIRITSLVRHSHLVQRWGPVLLWMAGIFYFSSRPTLPSPFSSSTFGSFFHAVGHFGEYAILAALLYRALVKQGQHERTKANPGEGKSPESDINRPLQHRSLGLSFLIALFFGFLDELHQGFVPGRETELADLVLDTLGMGVALTVIARAVQGRRVLPSRESRGGG